MNIGGYNVKGVKVNPKSAKNIFYLANYIREKLFKLKSSEEINIQDILEINLYKVFGVDNYAFEIINDSFMDGAEGSTQPDQMRIILSTSTYDALCDPKHPQHKRARFTGAHEIGHLFLHEGVSSALHRKLQGDHKIYEDSEWQANTFGAELLAPSHACVGLKVEEIEKMFNISWECAYHRSKKANMLK